MPNAAPWTAAEDVFLCRAYTNVSEDGATSTDQSSLLFWNRVVGVFMQLASPDGPSRNAGALQSRWSGLIRPDVGLYASSFASAKAEDHSGWTDEDYEAEARNRFIAKRELLNSNALRAYEEGVKKGNMKNKRNPRVKPEMFRLDHYDAVRRESVRFMREIPQPRKRPRLSLISAAETQDLEGEYRSGADDVLHDASEDPPPPARTTSAGKKKMKQLQFEEQVVKAMMHSQPELAKATSPQVEIMQQQLEVAQKKVDILETQQEAQKEQAEMAIMFISTEGLEEFGREYLLIKQQQRLDKLKK